MKLSILFLFFPLASLFTTITCKAFNFLIETYFRNSEERIVQKCKLSEAHQSDDMYFCFRWVLVWFKREFSFSDTCKLWEVGSAHFRFLRILSFSGDLDGPALPQFPASALRGHPGQSDHGHHRQQVRAHRDFEGEFFLENL